MVVVRQDVEDVDTGEGKDDKEDTVVVEVIGTNVVVSIAPWILLFGQYSALSFFRFLFSLL